MIAGGAVNAERLEIGGECIGGRRCQRRINSPQLWHLKIPQFS